MNPVNPPPSWPMPLAEYDVAGQIFWSLVVIGLIVLGFLAAMRVRRWLTEEEKPDDSSAGFTLGDLRRLHKLGRMTDEEFERAKAQMIAATQRAAERAAEEAARVAKEGGGVSGVDELRARARRNKAAAELAETDPESPESDMGPDAKADDN